ncbi:tetratricopeptide repeat protein [Neisseria chenwenguii]|uniref:tetratricopeptide repeat protein n=1 Tax=Neisseria chenwenguii TaxID=1853278 RepID=UPI000F4FD789|nr:tetratricopeptide repeat protein [Neisseria chenwenguii]ROV57294.1 tetratricopeptide repeat protein [Neisseria chenwenguii]
MFFAHSRLRAAVAAAVLLLAGQVRAADQPLAKPYSAKDFVRIVEKDAGLTPAQLREWEQQRRIAVVNRANNVFTLLGGEMALQKGDAAVALMTHMVMLERTRSPEVAERALEMAVALNAFEQAEAIYRRWQEIEPVPGEAQRRMGWMRNLLLGKADAKLSGLDDVLENASEEQTRRIFLLLAQAAVQQQGLAKKAGKEVHKVAGKYPQMPEAAIADVIYSAQEGNERHAVKALQRLARVDAEILPPTALTLRLVAQQNPGILQRFFKDTDTKKLSPVWQEMEISSLVAAKQTDKAYARLQELLADNPNADLYIQAALLANSRKEDISVISGYLDKAYNAGNSEQKSRAAVVGAMRYADLKQYRQAQTWVGRITAPGFVFDKAVLKASLAGEQGDVKTALAETRSAQKLPEKQGRFFSSADLQRVYLFALAKSDRPQEALSELNSLAAKAAKQRGGNELLPDILYQRAMVYEQLGRPEKAVADLRRVVQLNPNGAAGMNALGYTLLTSPDAQKNFDEAFKLIQTAYQLEPESGAINDSMGWAYYLKGDAQAALPYLQFAHKETPDAEVSAHLGEVLWKLGEQEQAKTVWAEGLKKGGNVKLLKATMQRFGVAVSSEKTAKAKKAR